jgi:hypothetical protein
MNLVCRVDNCTHFRAIYLDTKIGKRPRLMSFPTLLVYVYRDH